MVVNRQLRSPWCRRLALVGLVLVAACHTAPPVTVTANFVATPAMATRSPSQVAVLAIEDGTTQRLADQFLVFVRQEVMRQLPDRLYSPLRPDKVDAEMRRLPPASGTESIIVPATLKKYAGHVQEDAVLALRLGHWDETRLMVDRTVSFQIEATLLGSDGVTLWSGSMQGSVKAGGVGASPRDREAAARNCAELVVREMVLRLPMRVI